MSEPASPRTSTPSAVAHAWDRWLPVWHGIAAASLGLTTLAGLLGDQLATDELPLALLAAAVLAAGYAWLFVRRPPWEARLPVALGYLALAGLLWAVLLRLSISYVWLQPVLFTQVFFLVDRKRWWPLPIAWIVAVGLERQFLGDHRPFGELVPDILSAVATIGFFVVLAAWIGAIIEQSAERAHLIAELEAAQRELAERERLAGIHDERERLARELHDTLAQDLMSIVTQLQAADVAGDAEVAARHRAEAARMAHEGLGESRRIVAALRPELLESGSLVESLERTLADWRARTGVAASLTVTGASRPLHPEVEVALLRSLQEGLANAARHAAPTEVTVTLSFVGDEVALDVHDDGRGFDPAARATDPAGGFGLVGMRERVERLGGRIAIESTPGEGTTIGVTLPALAVS